MSLRNIAQHVIITAVLFSTTLAHATTWHVNGSCGNDAWTGMNEACAAPDGPKATIQAGINASSNGDTVLVAPGTYFESINLLGKRITLKSVDGPEVTTLDGTGIDDSVIVMIEGEELDTILEGFTITGGSGHFVSFSRRGGALYMAPYRSATIRSCRFIDNRADTGGAVFASLCQPIFFDCTFEGNHAYGSAGAAFVRGFSEPIVDQFVNCEFIGNSAGESAGALFVGGSSNPIGGNIVNCDFENNTAMNSGGALLRSTGYFTLSNCTFRNNAAPLGGAIHSTSYYWSASLTIDSCTFIENQATGGGAIYFYKLDDVFDGNVTTHTVHNCEFTSNEALIAGGAIYDDEIGPMIANCSFDYCNADQFLGIGGAIYCFRSDATITTCVFEFNRAGNGGSIACEQDCDIALSQCAFEQNSARYGGAIHAAFEVAVHCETATFNQNSATRGSDLLLIDGAASLVGITCEMADDESGERIEVIDGQLLIESSQFFHTGAPNLGWIMETEGASFVSISGSLFDGAGTGIVFGNGTVFSISNSTFVDCLYNAVVAYPTASGALQYCTFSRNGFGHGPAVSGSNVEVADCMFDGNGASPGRPSAVGAYSSGVTVKRCDFMNNNGVFVVLGNDESIIEDCTFLKNDTTYVIQIGGGLIQRCTIDGAHQAVEVYDGPLRVQDCDFRNINQFVLRLHAADVTLVDCNIEFDGAIAIYGTVLPNWDRFLRMFNCTFTGSGVVWEAASFDVGLRMTNCLVRNVQAVVSDILPHNDIELLNCTIYNADTLFSFETQPVNLPMVRVRNCVMLGGVPTTTNADLVDIQYSLVSSGWPGLGNISGNPLFVAPASGNFRLGSNSPCIDAGSNNAVGFDVADLDDDDNTTEFIPVDLDGNPRFRDRAATPDTGCGVGAIVDMGAYERQQGVIDQPVFGDLDHDHLVAGFDLALLLGDWGACSGCCLGDLNVSGAVDGEDLALLLGAWTVD